MKSNPTSTTSSLIDRWKDEHRKLDQFVDAITNWMHEVSSLGIPHFGEAGSRLTQLRERLVKHFQVEDQIAVELCEARPTCPERQAAKRQASRDHGQLLDRVDDLIERLSQLEPPFDSWQQAVYEIGLFIDALEQHEEQESENLQWLSPTR